MSRFHVIAVAVMFLAHSSVADELYGPPLASDLGHLFLAPTERHEIQRRRWSVPGDDEQPVEETSASPAKRDVFGLIVGPNRKPLVWVDGEFRETVAASRVPESVVNVERNTDQATDDNSDPEE